MLLSHLFVFFPLQLFNITSHHFKVKNNQISIEENIQIQPTKSIEITLSIVRITMPYILWVNIMQHLIEQLPLVGDYVDDFKIYTPCK